MCQIEITPDQLNRFPKTVPMNIREAILVVAQILIRIHMEQVTKTAPWNASRRKQSPSSPSLQSKKTKP